MTRYFLPPGPSLRYTVDLYLLCTPAMGICLDIKCASFVLLFLSAFAAVQVKQKIMKQANTILSEAPEHDVMQQRPLHTLTTCIRDTLKDSPQSQPERPRACVYGDKDGKLYVGQIRQRRRTLRMGNELFAFHRCLCAAISSHGVWYCHLKSNFLPPHLGDNTDLETGLLTYRRKVFQCRLHGNLSITCHVLKHQKPMPDSTFQMVLICLRNALESMVCDATESTSPTAAPLRPTTLSSSTQQPEEFFSSTAGLTILSLAAVLGLLIGVISTFCAIAVRRRKRKRLGDKSIVRRPNGRARDNSYADNTGQCNFYEDLPDTAVPDLLQQGPSVHSRFGSRQPMEVPKDNFSLKTHNTGAGYYEPLVRNGETIRPPDYNKPPLPARPDIKRGSDRSSGPNEYLDLVGESVSQHPQKEGNGTSGANNAEYFELLETVRSDDATSSNGHGEAKGNLDKTEDSEKLRPEGNGTSGANNVEYFTLEEPKQSGDAVSFKGPEEKGTPGENNVEYFILQEPMRSDAETIVGLNIGHTTSDPIFKSETDDVASSDGHSEAKGTSGKIPEAERIRPECTLGKMPDTKKTTPEETRSCDEDGEERIGLHNSVEEKCATQPVDFDLASSFKINGRSESERVKMSGDYSTISSASNDVAVEETASNDNPYFVLEQTTL